MLANIEKAALWAWLCALGASMALNSKDHKLLHGGWSDWLIVLYVLLFEFALFFFLFTVQDAWNRRKKKKKYGRGDVQPYRGELYERENPRDTRLL